MKRSGSPTGDATPKKPRYQTMEDTRKEKGVKAVRQQLEEKLQAGDYYHAQQLYKTLHARYDFQKILCTSVLIMPGTLPRSVSWPCENYLWRDPLRC